MDDFRFRNVAWNISDVNDSRGFAHILFNLSLKQRKTVIAKILLNVMHFVQQLNDYATVTVELVAASGI